MLMYHLQFRSLLKTTSFITHTEIYFAYGHTQPQKQVFINQHKSAHLVRIQAGDEFCGKGPEISADRKLRLSHC